jgi:hypothetical protein
MDITPQDTFTIGDTIWCEMRLPKELLDNASNRYINFEYSDLYFEMNISKWDSNKVGGGMLNFEIVQVAGSVTRFIDNFVYTYLEFESTLNRHFHFGLVPKVAGKYDIGIDFPFEYEEKEHLPSNDPERFRLTDSPCSQFMAEHSGVVINNGAINYHLIDGLCLPSIYSGDTFCMAPYEVVAKNGIYVFVVR